MYILRQVVVKVWEGNPVLCSDWLTDNDLVNVIEFIPILVTRERGGEGGREGEREKGGEGGLISYSYNK